MKLISCFLFICFFSLTLEAKELPDTSLESIDFPVHIRYLHFHPRGRELLIGSQSHSYIWDLKQKKIKYFLPAPFCQTKSMKFSPLGRYLVPSSRHCESRRKDKPSLPANKTKKIQLWDLRKKKKAFWGGEHIGELKLIEVGPREERLLSVARDGTIKLWSLREKRLLYSASIPRTSQESLALLPYALNLNLALLAVQNWQDYYILLYDLAPIMKKGPGKRGLKKNAPSLPAPRLLHRTEYPYSSSQSLFCFAPVQKLYFDGLRLRKIKDASLKDSLQYPPASFPKKAILNPQGTVLAILIERARKKAPSNAKKNKRPYSQILFYRLSKKGKLSKFAFFSLYRRGLRAKPESLVFHPKGHILAFADENRRVHFLSLP